MASDEVMWEDAAEGLDADARERLAEVVEQLVSAITTLRDLRGPLYTAALLVSLGKKLAP